MSQLELIQPILSVFVLALLGDLFQLGIEVFDRLLLLLQSLFQLPLLFFLHLLSLDDFALELKKVLSALNNRFLLAWSVEWILFLRHRLILP